MSQQIGPNHFGPERRESAEEKAKRILGEELSKLGLSAQLLPAATGAKLPIAQRLRTETTMSLRWIATQLGFTSWKYLSNLLAQKAATDSSQPTLNL